MLAKARGRVLNRNADNHAFTIMMELVFS